MTTSGRARRTEVSLTARSAGDFGLGTKRPPTSSTSSSTHAGDTSRGFGHDSQ